jgi:hypothetical protein
MAESSAKVVIRGDASHLINQAKAAEGAVDKVGKAGAGAAGQFAKMGMELTKTVARALALKVALKAALEGFKDYQRAAAQGSKDTGKSIVNRDLAAAKLGLSSSDAEGLTGANGPKSREEMTEFLTGLAGSEAGKRLDRAGVFRASSAYASGLVSQSEVEDYAKRGDLDGLNAEIARRRGSLSPEAQREMAIRTQENADANRSFAADSARGAEQRLAGSRYGANASESPIAGAVVKAIGAEEITQAFQSALDNQTDRLLEGSNRPTLAPGAE